MHRSWAAMQSIVRVVDAPRGIRTPNQKLRRLLLYPVELWARILTIYFEARYSVQLSYGREASDGAIHQNSWGEWWDLNPRSSGPQPDVLTPTPHPPRSFHHSGSNRDRIILHRPGQAVGLQIGRVSAWQTNTLGEANAEVITRRRKPLCEFA